MFEFAFHDYIQTNLTLTDFNDVIAYGTAEGYSSPYVIMRKVSDQEEREIYCDDQGDNGKALFQFSIYAGGENDEANAAYTIKIANDLKTQVAAIKGQITSVSHGNYTIFMNKTYGVRLIEGQILQTWGVIFESILNWGKL